MVAQGLAIAALWLRSRDAVFRLGFRLQGLGFRVRGLAGLTFRIQGFGFRGLYQTLQLRTAGETTEVHGSYYAAR